MTEVDLKKFQDAELKQKRGRPGQGLPSMTELFYLQGSKSEKTQLLKLVTLSMLKL